MRDGWMLDHNRARDQYQDGVYSGCRNSNVSIGSEDMEIVGEDSGSRGFLVAHGLEVELDDGSVHVGEDYGFEIDGDSGSYEQVLNRLAYSEKMLEAEELDIQDFSRNRISYDDDYDLRNVDGQCTAEDLEQFSVLKNYVQERSDELVKPSIKERLDPVQNIKERLRVRYRRWSYEATPNGLWVWQTLSNAEALAVKEDLIIWPPVVFVHNSSVVNANPDERMIVSIEKLKVIIKGMGFDRGMNKVCRGKHYGGELPRYPFWIASIMLRTNMGGLSSSKLLQGATAPVTDHKTQTRLQVLYMATWVS
ncbi:hypothetical protein Dsin_027115 [Dipteronia sinensis]|uniref:Uncharacterized protein n=1 Tax=Dipteronia sinensis TaxID=43782 RepID=A0AAD9ZZ41_9ROSI|nr:hypothetical protein Dsin_027115 [Dipteronia sinensis]